MSYRIISSGIKLPYDRIAHVGSGIAGVPGSRWSITTKETEYIPATDASVSEVKGLWRVGQNYESGSADYALTNLMSISSEIANATEIGERLIHATNVRSKSVTSEFGVYNPTRNGYAEVNPSGGNANTFLYPQSSKRFYVGCWVRATVTDYSDNVGYILVCRDNSAGGIAYALYVDTDNYIKARFKTSATESTVIASNTQIDTEWHYILLAVQLPNECAHHYLIVDNQLSISELVSPAVATTDCEGFTIKGINTDANGLYGFGGSVDEIVVGEWSVTDTSPISMVTIGNLGNAADTTGYGSVNYEYQIGRFEITAAEYTEFLNAVASTDTYSLYDPNMPTGDGCHIIQDGTYGLDDYTYSVASDYADRPVNYVSWGSAARFCNWLHNGKPTGAQDLTTTEDGSYYLNGATSNIDLAAVTRKTGATWAIPTEDEWYKAAYHKNDGVTANYWSYPTSSDTVPSNILTTPDAGNTATTFKDGVFTIGAPYYRTIVGEHENSASPYGTFDQGGNVWESNESVSTTSRGCRGSAWGVLNSSYMSSTYRTFAQPSTTATSRGFRVISLTVAATPEEITSITNYRFSPQTISSPVVDTTIHSAMLAQIQSNFETPLNSSVCFSFRASNDIYGPTDIVLSWTGFTSPAQVKSGEKTDLISLGVRGRYQQVRMRLTPSYEEVLRKGETPTVTFIETVYETESTPLNLTNIAYLPGQVLGQTVEFSGSKNFDKLTMDFTVSSKRPLYYIMGGDDSVSFQAANFSSSENSNYIGEITGSWRSSGATLYHLSPETDVPKLTYSLFFSQGGEYDVWGFGYGSVSFGFDGDTTDLRTAILEEPSPARPKWTRFGSFSVDAGTVHTFDVYLSSTGVIDQWYFTLDRGMLLQLADPTNYYLPLPLSEASFNTCVKVTSVGDSTSTLLWKPSSEIIDTGRFNYAIPSGSREFTDGITIEYRQFGGSAAHCAMWNYSRTDESVGPAYRIDGFGEERQWEL